MHLMIMPFGLRDPEYELRFCCFVVPARCLFEMRPRPVQYSPYVPTTTPLPPNLQASSGAMTLSARKQTNTAVHRRKKSSPRNETRGVYTHGDAPTRGARDRSSRWLSAIDRGGSPLAPARAPARSRARTRIAREPREQPRVCRQPAPCSHGCAPRAAAVCATVWGLALI